MKRFWFSFAFLIVGLWTAIRRLFYGRGRPTWSWLFESLLRLVKGMGLRYAPRGAGGLIQQLRLLDVAPLPFTRGIQRRFSEVAAPLGEWFVPRRDPTIKQTLLYLHGGGYVCCSTATHRTILAQLALLLPARVFGLNYRLAPEHPFPQALDDALAAYHWLLATGHDPAQLAIAGDSAGGGLALSTLVALRDNSSPLPAAAALISPWVDLAADDPSLVENAPYDYLGGHPQLLAEVALLYAGDAALTDPRVSPYYAELAGLPPLLLQVGEAEILRDQSLRLAAKARAAGVDCTLEVWPDMVHVWHAFSVIPQSRQAVTRIAEFLRRQMPAIARAVDSQ